MRQDGYGPLRMCQRLIFHPPCAPPQTHHDPRATRSQVLSHRFRRAICRNTPYAARARWLQTVPFWNLGHKTCPGPHRRMRLPHLMSRRAMPGSTLPPGAPPWQANQARRRCGSSAHHFRLQNRMKNRRPSPDPHSQLHRRTMPAPWVRCRSTCWSGGITRVPPGAMPRGESPAVWTDRPLFRIQACNSFGGQQT